MSLEQKLYDKILERIAKAETKKDLPDIEFDRNFSRDLSVHLKGYKMDLSSDKAEFILDKWQEKVNLIRETEKEKVIVEFLAEEGE